jgi:hypothetical protein
MADRLLSRAIEVRNSAIAPDCWCGHAMISHDERGCQESHGDDLTAGVICSGYSVLPPDQE